MSVLVLAACTDPSPAPTPSPTREPEVVPSPRSFYRSNWSGDAYARGATTYTAVGSLPQSRETLREPIDDRIFLAGEALSDDPGTVRGAVTSGRSAAYLALAAMAPGERIAVVGAGAAGSSAARVLVAGGADVVVVEARDRTGGRIDSNVVGDEFFELGAWRLDETVDGGVIDAARQEGVEFVPVQGGSAFGADGADAPLEQSTDDAVILAEALAEASAWALAQGEDVPVADAVREGVDLESWVTEGGPTSSELADQTLLSIAALTGADPGVLSSWFDVPAGGQSVVPVGPLSGFIDTALDGIDTALSTAVTVISRSDSGVSLRLATGESLSVDRVIVTAPVGVLRSDVLQFDPLLPVRYRGALSALSVGDIELIRLEFDAPFWDTEAVWWVRDDDAVVRMWVNLLPATGRPVLLGVVAGADAAALADLSDAALREAALRSLAPFAVQPTT